MFDLDSWQEVWVTITRNKRRSFLTAFGVFWGIFMLVAMLGAGNGLFNGIYSEVEGVSENSAFFFSSLTTEPYKGFRKGRYWSIQEEDLIVLQDQIPGIKMALPFMSSGQQTVTHADHFTNCRVNGMPSLYPTMLPQNLIYGRYINQIDIQECRKVCVLGQKVYESLFRKGENPVGQYIKLFDVYFQIIGVNKPLVSGVNVNGRDDENISLPYTVVQQLQNAGDEIHVLAIVAKDGQSIVPLENEVKRILKARHSIAPADETAVQSVNLEKIFKQFRLLFAGISLLIWIVGLGTLLAGVVGVSNIIMVTVRERTREIGVRRALGAKPSNILFQIIKESASLTLIAGFLGLSFGVLVLDVVDKVVIQNLSSDEMFFKDLQLDFQSAIIASAVILVSGLLAGILPAFRALQIKAIDAIREED